MSRFDVVSIGELLIDLVPMPAADDSLRFVAKPGGAPGNVAVGVARLGGHSAMLTKVGDEAFGRMLLNTLHTNGVVIDGIRTTSERRTGLAVVTLTPDGDRDFFFYRDGCADSDLSPEDLDLDVLGATAVFHVGSLFLAQSTSASAQRHAVKVAKERGIRISADPNLRVHLWRDEAAMLDAGREVVRAANILKISDDELLMLTGIEDIAQAMCKLWHPDLLVAAVTKGPKGAELITADRSVRVDGFQVETVDTIGCGDAFMATLLTELAMRNFRLDGEAAMVELARRACAAGAVTATRTGGMESLPSQQELDAFLAGRS
jgi:fructokinase